MTRKTDSLSWRNRRTCRRKDGSSVVSLSDGEWKIMNLLWERESTITELKNELRKETGWDKHIVITMLSRMEKKGAVAHRDGGRAKIFYPLVTREEVSMQETRGFLQKVYRGSLGMMVNAMVEDHALSEEEIQELYGILVQAKKRNGGCDARGEKKELQ
ncbi:MAG: BlaI/MecI/CopY family transcriptional regulator [Lachnospiraceae bacterium]|nr:BlaI/MecI/CopY family transcriptional regulator [Lachnospiraceae bacterium]